MEKHLTFFVLISVAIASISQPSSATCPDSPKKLFLFGDSYLDTGNTPQDFPSWRLPYGISLGKPNGRFCDGLLWTDLLATYMGLYNLVPYSRVGASNKESTCNGVNFAVGGSSLFPNPFMNVTMDVQLDQFKELANAGLYTVCDLKKSVAFVSISINDYMSYNRFTFPYAPHTAAIVAQLKANLQILHVFGIGKIAVASLPPLGCLPDVATDSPYPGSCNEKVNEGTRSHNEALKAAVDDLNGVNNEKNIEYVDFYGTFSAAMDELARTSNSNPTKRCCVNCQMPTYEVCDNPGQAFFWDGNHPAQNGWKLVFDKLKDDIQRLLA